MQRWEHLIAEDRRHARKGGDWRLSDGRSLDGDEASVLGGEGWRLVEVRAVGAVATLYLTRPG